MPWVIRIEVSGFAFNVVAVAGGGGGGDDNSWESWTGGANL